MKGAQIGERKPLFWETRQVPFFLLLLFYLCGIVTARWLEPSVKIHHVLGLMLPVLLLAFYVSFAFRWRMTNGSTGLPSLLFYLFLYVLGWFSLWQPHPVLNGRHYSHLEADYLIGYIDDEPRTTATGVRFPVRISHAYGDQDVEPASGRLMVGLRTKDPSVLNYGDELIIPARYRENSPPYNPHEFDYRAYLENQGIWHSIYLPDSLVHRIGLRKGNWLKQGALDLRTAWVEKLRRSFRNNEHFAVASALVLGYRGVLEPETLQRFSKTGTIHVLSVSGLHVGIVFAVFSFLLRWMKGKHMDILRGLLLIGAVWMYALLTGFSPSVLRAATMISFGIIALTMYRQGQIFNTICASAFLLLLYNPAFLFEIGFVLSYLAVLGIVGLHPIIQASLQHPSRWVSAIVSYASISLAAQWATFPFVFYYFQFFPVYFLPANMLIILPATLVVYLSVVVLILPPGSLHALASQLLELVMEGMNRILQFFENLPYATVEGVGVSAPENALLYLLIVLTYLLVFIRKKMLIYLMVLATAGGILSGSYQKFNRMNRSKVVFYNVNRDFAISFVQNGTSHVFSNLSPESRSFQYSIQPDLNVRANSAATVIQESESYGGSELIIESGLIQFGGRRVFLYSTERAFTAHIDVDILYIRNNSLKNLRSAAESIRFKKIILDGSNHDSYLEKIKTEAEILDKPVYILKNNYAYVW